MAFLPPVPAKYKGRFLCGAALLALFVVAAVYGGHGLMHLRRMRTDQLELERMVFERQQRSEQLRERILRLQTDDRYIEKLARERLGMVKPGEIIYRAAAQPESRPH
jgi:cell division protein FtsB